MTQEVFSSLQSAVNILLEGKDRNSGESASLKSSFQADLPILTVGLPTPTNQSEISSP